MSISGTQDIGSEGINIQSGATKTPDEAIVLTGNGKFHWLLLLGCGFCALGLVECYMPSFVLPAAQCEFEMDSSKKGLLSALPYIGMILSSHLWGYLADTKGRRKILILSLLLDGVCAVLSSFAHAYWLFALFRFFNGFFICAASAVGFAYLGEFHSPATRARAMMFASAGLTIGCIFLQGLSWWMIPLKWKLEVPWIDINYSSWRAFLVCGSMPSFLGMITLFFLPESPKFLFSVGKQDKALEVLRHVYSLNTGRNPEEYPVSQLNIENSERDISSKVQLKTLMEILESMWVQTVPLFKKPHIRITALVFFLQFSLNACYTSFSMWAPDLFNHLSEYSNQNPHSTMTICQVMNTLKEEADSDTTVVKLQPSSSENNMTDFKYSVLGEDVQTCTTSVNPEAYRNFMVIGGFCLLMYTTTGVIVNFLQKKTIMEGFLLVAGLSGIGLYFSSAEWLVIVLSGIFVSFAGACSNLLNSLVVEFIPTQLRAMAVCLSLMCGRFGAAVFSSVLGLLLDADCSAAVFFLSATLLMCCLLSFLLPNPSKT